MIKKKKTETTECHLHTDEIELVLRPRWLQLLHNQLVTAVK